MRYLLTLAAVLAVAGLSAAEERKPAADRDVQDFVYLGDKGPVLIRLHVRVDGKPLVVVWEAFMGRLFAYLDVDGDGTLSKTEAARVPPIPLLFNNGPGILAARGNAGVEAIDKNKDGKITRAELADWYRRNGAAPFQISAAGGPPLRPPPALGVQSRTLSAAAFNEKLFALLDTNKDGKLSHEELVRAPAALHKLDLDDDEMISAQELSGNDETPNQQLVVARLYAEQQAMNSGPFVLLRSGETNRDLAQRLLQQYGRKGQKTSAKQLTRRDLGLDEAAFKQLDRDEDGKLDGEELAHFAERPPDLELLVRLGKKADQEAAMETLTSKEHATPLARSIRTGTNGSLRLELGTVQIELGGVDSSNNPQFARQLRQQYLVQFRMADKDNNGYLDDKEASQSRFFRNVFTMLDRDGDGKLFEKEVVGFLDRMGELQASAMRSCASLAIRDQGRGLFDLVDSNSDGRLGIRELRQMGKLIDQLDRDGDGQVSPGEVPHKYRVDVRRGPAVGNQFTPRVVVVRKALTDNRPELPDGVGPRWFRKMDRNRDGDVSRREFLGTDKEFRSIDRDGDGLISVEEAQRADERFRKRIRSNAPG